MLTKYQRDQFESRRRVVCKSIEEAKSVQAPLPVETEIVPYTKMTGWGRYREYRVIAS